MNNKKILEIEGRRYFQKNIKNNKKYAISNTGGDVLLKVLDIINIKPKNILEIGCANGVKLELINKFYTEKNYKCNLYGAEISKYVVRQFKKKKNINIYNYSSLEINKFKVSFDIIICGYFLYLLDRKEIFRQFDLILKKLNNEGYLIINDFSVPYPMWNKNQHIKNMITYKSNYIDFLKNSNNFKFEHHINYKSKKNKKKYNYDDCGITVFKKIYFTKQYRNIS